MSLDCEVVFTQSGARAMLDRTSGEVMHPVVGPLAESGRLYVVPSQLEAKLRAGGAEPLVLLDVGLGAGSNAAAAWRLSESLSKRARRLVIVSFDVSLNALALALAPEYAQDFGLTGSAASAARGLCELGHHQSGRTSWRLASGDVRATLELEPPGSAEVVFWDPFSPRNNPALWTWRTFQSLRRVCLANATVHTYSGATSVRAALLLAGFWVGVGEKIAEGKYGTTASPSAEGLELPLDRRWLARLARSSAPFPADAPPDALERIRNSPQFT